MLIRQPLRALFVGRVLAECQAICVPPNMVPQIWPHVWPMLKKAIERTDWGTFKVLEDDVFEARALLWLAWQAPEVKAAVVTQLCANENSKDCYILACGGKQSKDWLSLMANIEAYARAEGCNKIRAIGRRGWIRLLPDFHAPFVVIEKDLN